MVSFGASVYVLHVALLYGRRFDDDDAIALFDRGARGLLDAQGPHGEWPWQLRSCDARPLDVYPVFSVHQISMAMLFLFGARERGLAGSQDAIERSLAYVMGENQLGLPMIQRDPFFIYRSVERNDRLPRAQRYVRSLGRALASAPGGLAPDNRVHFNRESRAYELGWILYLLSSEPQLPVVDAAWERLTAGAPRVNSGAPG